MNFFVNQFCVKLFKMRAPQKKKKAIALMLLPLIGRRQRRKKNRSIWTKNWLSKREVSGAVAELLRDIEAEENCQVI